MKGRERQEGLIQNNTLLVQHYVDTLCKQTVKDTVFLFFFNFQIHLALKRE